MTLKILLFGRTGQVADAIRRSAGAAFSVEALSREEADLTDPAGCSQLIAVAAADVVINAAAYTAVDHAEDEEELATLINAITPGAMAEAAASRNLPFLHISTDYVFDGSGTRPWRESDRPAPLNAYGRSKLAGERLVAAAGGPHVVLRTSWVYSAIGSNFVRTMLRLGRDRDRLSVIDDQLGGPTAASDIAQTLLQIASAFGQGHAVSGVFHFSSVPAVSWAGFAREIFCRAGWDRVPEVAPIRSEDWPAKAARPKNSVLDCCGIRSAYGIEQPDWRASLAALLAEIQENTK